MKKGIETILMAFVILITLFIVGLIGWFVVSKKTTHDTTQADVFKKQSQTNVKKATSTDYLKSLEGYEEKDVTAKMIKKNKAKTNIIEVKTENTNEDVFTEIDAAIDTAKKIDSYVDNLENYDESAKVKQEENAVEKEASQEEKVKKEDPMGEIFGDIDAIVNTTQK